jgi:predicted O-linked N-acetylglucosamine transferase (SPINDLY family)
MATGTKIRQAHFMSSLQQLRAQGAAHLAAGRAAEAEAAFAALAARAPGDADAQAQHGQALEMLGRATEAADAYRRAIAANPNHIFALFQLATLLRRLSPGPEALAAYDACARLAPQEPQVFIQRAACKFESEDYAGALADFDRAILLVQQAAAAGRQDRRISLPDLFFNRAAALENLGRDVEALAAYDQVLKLMPGAANAWSNRGILLRKEARLEEAAASFRRALALDPRHIPARTNRGVVLTLLHRYAEAQADFERALEIEPDNPHALGGLLSVALPRCDWEMLDRILPRLAANIPSGRAVASPFHLSLAFSDPALLRDGAAHFRRTWLPRNQPRPPLREGGGRIRVAYLSADYQVHATAHLIADLFTRHDRARFEVIAISYGADHPSPMRERLRRGVDQFIDVQTFSDAQVAELMRNLGVDIAVDLKGYTQWSRCEILAYGAAPVQVSWLGYPGTLASGFCDYVIADRHVLPHAEQPNWDEKIVHLPDTYQVNDPERPHPVPGTRAEAGLPSEGFVFGCFNNHTKILPAQFGIWMRLLAAVPGSVLWLLDDSACDVLRDRAAAHGIDPARLVFAPKVSADEHLRRLPHAGLMLDTLPYGMHTTASDALWMGVPVVTCRGTSFAGRVAAGLLTAFECPELITETLEDYEALALALARDPARLAALRAKLADKRLTAPLFDAPRFCRHLEQAYETMMEIARAGEAPRAFDVQPV